METITRNYRQFIEESGVDELIEKLQIKIAENNGGKTPIYSDLVKEEEGEIFQYVNYVQEGGGVLGVALIGYTYVLEKLGMRFLKLAGTSAGAINTIMLASVNKENYKEAGFNFKYRSEIILQEMLNYDLWKLVDGSKAGKWLIRMFIGSRNGLTVLKWTLLLSLIIPVVFALIITLCSLLPHFVVPAWISALNIFLVVVTAIALLILILSGLLIIFYAKRFARAGFGINPGKQFYDWIRDILARNNIKTVADLNKIMQEQTKGLQLRKERQSSNDAGDTVIINGPYLTIVASDITNETKVEFPAMAKEYWKEPDMVNPADFVRASMSIPIFFEPFTVTVSKEVKEKSTLQKLKQTLSRRILDSYPVSFVDGGILSNFPINVFHNPKIKIARLPTFGVKLEDQTHKKTTTNPSLRKGKLFSFLGKIFSTIRFYYDRDFLKQNAIYEMSIAHIDVSGFNWLNFDIDNKTQLELFKKGAAAAEAFFLGGTIWVDGKEKIFEPFNWEKFKEERAKMLES